MNKAFEINAQGKDDRQLSNQLGLMAKAAGDIDAGGLAAFAATHLNNASEELQQVISDSSWKITYLESIQTTASGEHAIQVQEGLVLLREVLRPIRDAQQTIDSCLSPLRQSQEKRWHQLAQNVDSGF